MLANLIRPVTLCCAFLSCSFAFGQAAQAVPAAHPAQATTQLVGTRGDTLHPGDEIAFRIKLNDPLPPGAYFSVRLSPVAFNSEYAIGSGEPVDAERKEFLVKSKLPEGAFPGEWHISVIWLFLSGTSWTNKNLSFNDVHFTVEGKQYQVPTSATVKLAKASD